MRLRHRIGLNRKVNFVNGVNLFHRFGPLRFSSETEVNMIGMGGGGLSHHTDRHFGKLMIVICTWLEF